MFLEATIASSSCRPWTPWRHGPRTIAALVPPAPPSRLNSGPTDKAALVMPTSTRTRAVPTVSSSSTTGSWVGDTMLEACPSMALHSTMQLHSTLSTGLRQVGAEGHPHLPQHLLPMARLHRRDLPTARTTPPGRASLTPTMIVIS